ncbi:oligosaccharide flippase family protein [Shimia biformata]|uniref:oligosaccharide flippase family protein n=1 Tax=Shimia biformata TaxID=1294299 RepID=UPI001EF3472B|nr:oligosaccharide flippase family protein [Shimia biformata]
MSVPTPLRIRAMLVGSGLGARALRGSALTVLGYGGSQALRLASNLILTRLLFPEAFGVMALVWVFMQGLANFSDLGIGHSILQNKRGDDPDFLDTAWTLQILRGVVLWLATVALAWPAAQFYDAPELAQLLPVVGLTLLIAGLNPTRLDTAQRHLALGRVTVIDLVSQTVGLVAGVLVAWVTMSIWALVVSAVTTSAMQLLLYSALLPGHRNRLRWEPAAIQELVRFGKWIFLSTIAGFLLAQGDKIILGKYLSLGALGVYNIGYFLASFPLLLGWMVLRRILIPVYREAPPADSPANFAKLRKLRIVLTAGILTLIFAFALLGPWLVELLYDPRYLPAGGVVVLMSLALVPQVIMATYDHAALAAGESRRYFVLSVWRALFMVAGLLVGVSLGGLPGALVGQGVAMVLIAPFVVALARRYGAWDPLHDAIFWSVSLILTILILSRNAEAIAGLNALNLP